MYIYAQTHTHISNTMIGLAGPENPKNPSNCDHKETYYYVKSRKAIYIQEDKCKRERERERERAG